MKTTLKVFAAITAFQSAVFESQLRDRQEINTAFLFCNDRFFVCLATN